MSFITDLKCKAKGSAKAIAAFIVASAVSYGARKGLHFTALDQMFATAAITSAVVWFTRNTQCPA